MSAPDINSIEHLASQSAHHLLNDSAEWLKVFLDYNERPSQAECVLMVGYATLAQRCAHYEERRADFLKVLETLEQTADRIDASAIRPGAESFTEREKNIVYEALEADLLKNAQTFGELEEIGAALPRFRRLVGLTESNPSERKTSGDGDQPNETARQHQAEDDYEWLKKLVSDAHLMVANEAEYDEVHARIKRLSGV